MKALFALVVLVAVAGLVAAGETPTHDDVVKQVLATLDKFALTLTSITNQQSADAARPELRKTAQEWSLVRAKAEKLPPPARDEKDRLEKEYKGKLDKAQKRLFGEVVRVQNVPGGPEALKEIRSVLSRPMK